MKMNMSNIAPFSNTFAYCSFYRAVSGTPSQHQQFSFIFSGISFCKRNIVGNFLNLGCSQVHHLFMVQCIIRYISCFILFFQSANAMFQTLCSWLNPGTNQFFITFIWQQCSFCTIRFIKEFYSNRFQFIFGRETPRF